MQVQRIQRQAYQDTGQIKKIGEPENTKEWLRVISISFLPDTLQGWEPYNRLATIIYRGKYYLYMAQTG